MKNELVERDVVKCLMETNWFDPCLPSGLFMRAWADAGSLIEP